MRPVSVLFLTLCCALSACADQQKPKPKAAPPPDPIASAEKLAFEAERQINTAEEELSALHPDAAVEHLDLSEKLLSDPAVDRYPDAKRLRERHTDLTAKVPGVREEVRKRELAAAVAAARQKIDAAKGALKESLAEIKKREPSEDELKKAVDAVEALRSALDEASDLESKDTDYAKYSLASRKDAADKKKIVEQRRLDVAVEQGREEIAHALGELVASMKHIQNRDVVDNDFAAARSSADAVQKAIGAREPLGGRDAKFGKFIADSKTKLDAQKTAIDKREHDVTVTRQKKKVEEGRKALADALQRINRKDVVDGDLAEAATATKTVSLALKEGAELASKDKDYSNYAAEVQKRLDEATAKIAARKLSVLVDRKKMEIGNARATLADAMKTVSAKAPVEGDFEAAKNAVTLVEKSLDSAEALSAKDRELAKWVLEQRRALQNSRVAIDKRKLDVEIAAHRAVVAGALASMKSSVGKMNTAEDVSASEGLVTELEKALDAGDKYGAKDSGYSKFAIEARKAAVDAHKKIREKSDLIAMDQQKAKVDHEIEGVKGAVAALEGFSVTAEQFKAADDAIAGTKKAFDEGVELEKKLAHYNGWAVAKRKWLESAEDKVGKRKTAIALREHRLLIEQAFEAAKLSGEAAKGAEATGLMVSDALAAVKSAKDELDKAAELEKSDKAFASFTAATKKNLDKIQDALDSLKTTVAFRDGPLSALHEGLKLVGGAEAQPPEEQSKAYSAALEQFQNCKKDGAAIIADHPKIATATFVVAKKKQKASAVLVMCGEQAKSADAKISGLSATVEFIEGPARSFTKGKALLDEAEKAAEPAAKKKVAGEALTHFEECVEKGKVLQYKHPELNKAKFDVDGQVLTLPFVVTSCQKEAKSLRGGAGPST